MNPKRERPETENATKNRPSHVREQWGLAGQSNMQGGGLLRDTLPPDTRVRVFSSAGRWEVAETPLHRLWESFTESHLRLLRGYHRTPAEISNTVMAQKEARLRVTGAGLDLAFGQAMADATGKGIDLIPCAHGGTSLDQWSPLHKGEASLYGAMLERIRRANGKLSGVLWYQGESDNAAGLAETYGSRLKRWMEALRRDTGQPKLPIYLVQVGRIVMPPSNQSQPISGWETVREAQRLLGEDMPQSGVTSAIDLGLVDYIHLDSSSLIRLGKRLARLALGHPSPRVKGLFRHRKEEKFRGGNGVVQVRCTGLAGGWSHVEKPLSGFSVRTPHGEPHPDLCIVQAEVPKDNTGLIRLILNKPFDESIRIGYGLGLNPFCNVADTADMPLCAFLPQKVISTS